MTGEYNKAWVALLVAALIIIEDWTGWKSGITEEWIITILAVISPIVVWLIPNKTT